MLITESIFRLCNRMNYICRMHSIWIYLLSVTVLTFALNTDVLWQSCSTTICGRRQLNIQCERSSYILINNVSSDLGREFDLRSYNNLRRLCLGLVICEPSRAGFCHTHSNAEFNVSYICVRDQDVDKECVPRGKPVSNNIGFITSPNYPAESRFKSCTWRIRVPPGHYAHIFLHEVLPISSRQGLCHGLLFMADSTCGKFLPSVPICDESRVDTLISSCSDMDITMTANSTYSMRFWLSYYVLPVPDVREVVLFDTDITCNTYKKDKLIYRPRLPTNTVAVSPGLTPPNNHSRDVIGKSSSDEDNTAVYIGVAVAVVVVLIIILVVAVIYVRRRRSYQPKVVISPSTTNSSETQKHPLPDGQIQSESNSSDPVLGEGYSSVADEINPSDKSYHKTYSTYTEIEDSKEGGLRPEPKVINRRSIGSSERKLPATPKEEPYKSGYSEIESKNVPYIAKITEKNCKHISPSRSRFNEIKAKYEREKEMENENTGSGYSGAKKMSNASNIYADIPDFPESGEKTDANKTYVDMSNKQRTDAERLKGVKDKFNLSKKTQGTHYTENIDFKRGNVPRKVTPSWKKDSITSAESDSDDGLCIVDNELYEPFESAKV